MKKKIYSNQIRLSYKNFILIVIFLVIIIKIYLMLGGETRKTYPTTQHPRLFVNRNDIRGIKERINNTENRLAWKRLLEISNENIKNQSFDTQDEIIKANALKYLLYKDTASGSKAVEDFKNLDLEISNLNQKLSDSYSLSNTAGQIMVAGSMVYDWCYDLLDSKDKSFFIKNFKILASYLEVGYPDNNLGYLVGHGSEKSILLYLLSAGIATYNEDPQMFNYASNQILNNIVPARKFTNTAEMYYQGSSYGPERYESEMYSVILFDKIGYKNVFGADHGKVPIQWIYSLRPDGQFIRDGDIYTRIGAGSRWTFINTFLLSANYYNNPFLQQELIDEYEYKKHSDKVPMDPILQILFFDINKPKKQFKELPLTKYFPSPEGYMIARTGWDKGINSNSVVASFKVGEYHFNNHEHLDSGSFQVYYKGALAIDSGIYEGSSYGADHDLNYNKRTIAHNSVLVYDPKETFYFGNKKLINDGGQRYPEDGTEPKSLIELLNNDYKFGKVLRYDFGPNVIEPLYSFMEGDLTNCYSSKIEKYTRSFLFINNKDKLNPATIIILDRIKSSNSSYKKYFLFHSIQKPQVNKNVTTIVRDYGNYNGKLINTTLLPENINIEIIGGKGNEFNVFGTNFPYYLEPTVSETYESGSWRTQIGSTQEKESDTFLNVMQLVTSTQANTLKVTSIDSKDFMGVNLKKIAVFYIKNTRNNNDKFEINLSKEQFSNSINLIFPDLPNGRWTVKVNGNVIAKNNVINGVLFLKSSPGIITLEKGN